MGYISFHKSSDRMLQTVGYISFHKSSDRMLQTVGYFSFHKSNADITINKNILNII